MTEWTAEFEFRATGPERGGGNLQIWYTREGQANVGTSSVYTIGKFDGLALTVDMYGGRVFSLHLRLYLHINVVLTQIMVGRIN